MIDYETDSLYMTTYRFVPYSGRNAYDLIKFDNKSFAPKVIHSDIFENTNGYKGTLIFSKGMIWFLSAESESWICSLDPATGKIKKHKDFDGRKSSMWTWSGKEPMVEFERHLMDLDFDKNTMTERYRYVGPGTSDSTMMGAYKMFDGGIIYKIQENSYEFYYLGFKDFTTGEDKKITEKKDSKRSHEIYQFIFPYFPNRPPQ